MPRLHENKIIELDDHLLEDCVVRNCVLVLRGGPINIRPSVQIETNCKLEFYGCAASTVMALRGFYKNMKDEVLRHLAPPE